MEQIWGLPSGHDCLSEPLLIPQKLPLLFLFWCLKDKRSRSQYHAGSSIAQTLSAEFCDWFSVNNGLAAASH